VYEIVITNTVYSTTKQQIINNTKTIWCNHKYNQSNFSIISSSPFRRC